MAIYRAQIGFPMDTAFPRDVVTMNPHYFGDNAQGLADALAVNLNNIVEVGPTVPFTIKIYDAQKAPPSYPLAEKHVGTGFTVTSHPREVSLCLSYYSSFNRPSYRGRVYVPAHFLGGTFGLRPTATQIGHAANFATAFGRNLPAQHNWVVYSRKLDQSNGVSHYYVDDEWDIVRSRGMRSTTREAGTIP
jgi:hypothetical protein